MCCQLSKQIEKINKDLNSTKRVQNLECKTMLVKHAFLASYRKVSVILRPLAGISSNKDNQEKTVWVKRKFRTSNGIAMACACYVDLLLCQERVCCLALAWKQLDTNVWDIPDGCKLYFLGLIKVTNWLLATKIANTKSWGERESSNNLIPLHWIFKWLFKVC